MNCSVFTQVRMALSNVAAAIAFYTCLPVPTNWILEFQGVARLAPVVGLFIGGLLGLVELGLKASGIPDLTRSVLLVAVWIVVTGGLHLDGAIDTADGLAVQNPDRRLQVMTESTTGAFGVMAGIVVLLLKTAALSDMKTQSWLALMAAAGWGRWGQQVAIACYPYLKPEGKGAFHQAALRSLIDTIPGLMLMLGLSGLQFSLHPQQGIAALATAIGGSTIAILTGAWFNLKLGGHTGDTYGAVVEWTEALLLCLLTIFLGDR